MSIEVIAVNSNGQHIFRGLPADEKGSGTLTLSNGNSVSYEVGSVFYETDNGNEFYFSGARGWKAAAGKSVVGTLAATTVAVAGLTVIGAAIDVSNSDEITVNILNGDNAFDAFAISYSVDGGVTFNTLYATPADFGNPQGFLVAADSDLVTLPAATVGMFTLDCKSFDYIRLQASADTAESAGVTSTWSAK